MCCVCALLMSQTFWGCDKINFDNLELSKVGSRQNHCGIICWSVSCVLEPCIMSKPEMSILKQRIR